jgi:two-component system sensor histidine kinase VicK
MVFQNLLSNAVKYTPEGGEIRMTLAFDGGKRNVLFEISDTGYGIPKRQQGKIYTKFFRADNVKAKDTEGTGLGLYLAKSIVEHLGGKIWFVSGEDEGTTFFVALPTEATHQRRVGKGA